MPRHKRPQSTTGVYHWINRGVNHKKLFHKDADYKHFLGLVKEHKGPSEIEIYHYCLMSNHIHILLKSPANQNLALFSQMVQRRYAYYYCKTYKWRGQVFQRMYKSLPVERDAYLLECGRYIERNPVRAKMVKHPGEYSYSSHGYYSYGTKSDILNPSPAFLGISENESLRRIAYSDYVVQERIYEELVDKALLGI